MKFFFAKHIFRRIWITNIVLHIKYNGYSKVNTNFVKTNKILLWKRNTKINPIEEVKDTLGCSKKELVMCTYNHGIIYRVSQKTHHLEFNSFCLEISLYDQKLATYILIREYVYNWLLFMVAVSEICQKMKKRWDYVLNPFLILISK